MYDARHSAAILTDNTPGGAGNADPAPEAGAALRDLHHGRRARTASSFSHDAVEVGMTMRTMIKAYVIILSVAAAGVGSGMVATAAADRFSGAAADSMSIDQTLRSAGVVDPSDCGNCD